MRCVGHCRGAAKFLGTSGVWALHGAPGSAWGIVVVLQWTSGSAVGAAAEWALQAVLGARHWAVGSGKAVGALGRALGILWCAGHWKGN